MPNERLTLTAGSRSLTIGDAGPVRLDTEPDWGTAALEATLAEGPLLTGGRVSARRRPAREIKLGLRIAAASAPAFLAAQHDVARIAGGWQANGGTIRREIVFADGTSEALELTVLSAELTHGDEWLAAHRKKARVELTATCDPDWLADWEQVGQTLASANPVISAAVANARGDVPGPLRVKVKDNTSSGRQFCEVGAESEAVSGYNPAAPSSLLLDSAAFTLGAGATSETDSGAHGAGANCIELDPLLGAWRIVGELAGLTSKGSRRFRGRFKNTTAASAVSVRLAYRADGGPWEYPRAVPVPLWAPAAYFDVDLGRVAVPAGTGDIDLRIEASAPGGLTPAGTGVRFDFLTDTPAERYVLARGCVLAAAPGALIAYDDFGGMIPESALDARVPPITPAGNWALAGDPDPDWIAESGDRVGRAAIDTSVSAGQFALLGTSSQAAITIDIAAGRLLKGIPERLGIAARYADPSNWLFCGLRAPSGQTAPVVVEVVKFIAGVATTLATATLPPGYAEQGSIRVTASAAGAFTVSIGPYGSAPAAGTLFLSGSDAALATGGPLASGRFGLYHGQTSGLHSPVAGVTAILAYSGVPASETVYAAQPSGGRLVLETASARSEDAAGANRAPVFSHRGSDLYLPPGASRVTAKARRADSETQPDTGIADSADLTAEHRPAFLFASGELG